MGSSGTTLYFLLGLGALADRPVRFTGQRYFRRRPIGPLLRALRRLGYASRPRTSAPGHRLPGRPPGRRRAVDGTLSQWVSGLLMLAPFAREPTTIEVEGELNERPTRADCLDDARLRAPGRGARGLSVRDRAGAASSARRHVLPPDLGSVVFPLAACTLHPSRATFRSSTPIAGHPEAAVLENLRAAGVPMRIDSDATRSRSTTTVSPPAAAARLPRPSRHGAGALGAGEPRTRGERAWHVSHVRLKESDRVASMLQLERMGARVEFDGEDMRFRASPSSGGDLSSFNDHRVLMALTVAGASARGVTELSFPTPTASPIPSSSST